MTAIKSNINLPKMCRIYVCFSDGFQESNVVTKTFQVEDVGEAGENQDDLVDQMFDLESNGESIDSYKPQKTSKSLTGTRTGTKKVSTIHCNDLLIKILYSNVQPQLSVSTLTKPQKTFKSLTAT